MPIYERGQVRIHYEEAGTGFPLLLIPGGGLNSTIEFVTRKGPFNAIEEFKTEYRSLPIFVTPMAAGQKVRWRSTGRGTRTPMTNSD